MNFCNWGLVATILLLTSPQTSARDTQKQVFFGDTHLHSSLSFDSFIFGNESAGPDTAYRYAKGLPVVHPSHRARVRIKTPLDFLVVADHAEMMGTANRLAERDPEYLKSEEGRSLVDKFSTSEGREEISREWFSAIRREQSKPPGMGLINDVITTSVWKESISIAERHNEPNRFTTLIGWEWSPRPGGKLLHRVVLMPNGADVASRFVPFSAYDSNKPEDLWAWFEKVSAETGADFIAIPHNSNLSEGAAFPNVDSFGQSLSRSYSRQRMKWEPLVEVTQGKGDSETHVLLSPDDIFAGFEAFQKPHPLDAPKTGSYVRSGLLTGIRTAATIGENPFKFGMLASTDQHTGLSSTEEDNFHGKFPLDATPEDALIPYGTWKNEGWNFSPGGLAAVWAEENTRGSLFAAFRRKEVYATSGTRIRVRIFGGWNFDKLDLKSGEFAEIGYQKGVPMGGDLSEAPAGKKPGFLIYAAKDSDGANLDRIQIIKGWIDDRGNSHERIFDVALADGRKPDADGKIEPVGNSVNISEASYSNTIGDVELATLWTDSEFEPSQWAFYYARVLEIPTPRHSLIDAVALKIEHPDKHPATIQERAYTSPIWYTP